MNTFAITICATAFGLVLPLAASAAENGDRSNASTVDPTTRKADTVGARPATAGTTGAMENAGGGSFTASKEDQKKHLTDSK